MSRQPILKIIPQRTSLSCAPAPPRPLGFPSAPAGGAIPRKPPGSEGRIDCGGGGVVPGGVCGPCAAWLGGGFPCIDLVGGGIANGLRRLRARKIFLEGRPPWRPPRFQIGVWERGKNFRNCSHAAVSARPLHGDPA